ncbi:hypothetical protein CEXT_720971 [Caerostris extrusa]|uniref:Uncharacterized protein n=1 Tax=Caerostris extrusa TaxID=172846 RepID=A0AAV4M9B3_CAEEX|nr:hypothetical protein CEXT_720971 [Caerostris extrusa]
MKVTGRLYNRTRRRAILQYKKRKECSHVGFTTFLEHEEEGMHLRRLYYRIERRKSVHGGEEDDSQDVLGKVILQYRKEKDCPLEVVEHTYRKTGEMKMEGFNTGQKEKKIIAGKDILQTERRNAYVIRQNEERMSLLEEKVILQKDTKMKDGYATRQKEEMSPRGRGDRYTAGQKRGNKVSKTCTTID